MSRKYLVATLVLCLVAFAASSGEAKKKTFAKKIGGLEIITLVDSEFVAQPSLLIGASAEVLKKAENADTRKASINAFVVKMNGKNILFDTGLPREQSGGILPALAEAQMGPSDIDAIVITHFHGDHVGGLMDGDKPVFNRAEVYVPRYEVDKWSDPGTDFLLAYNVRTNAFEYNSEVLPGVTAIAAQGHTPGHTIYRLEAGDGKLLIVGDLIHVVGIQFANPEVAVGFDKDPVKAVEARKVAFDMAVNQKLPIAGMHIPAPAMGVLTKDGSGYAFEPF